MAHLDDTLWASTLAHDDTQLGPPATDDVLAAFEAEHGLVLPPSYRDFLRRGNGGVVGCVRLYGIGRSDSLDLAKSGVGARQEIESMADGPVLPFASEWGGSLYCYDLRRCDGTGEYPILLWHHEYAEEPSERPLLWSEFAPDFVEFIRLVVAEA